jgi:hypothetical protein
MSYLNIITRIKTDLDSVSGIGKTYELKKNVHDEHTKHELFKSSGILHAWFIYRDVVDPSLDYHTLVTRRNHFYIDGYYAHKKRTETQKTFQALVDDVCNMIVNDRLLGGYGYIITPPVGSNIDEVMFCDMLCDHCQISFEVLTVHSAGNKDMIYTGTETFLTSAARTSSSASAAFNVEKYLEGNFYVDVTAASGTNEELLLTAQSSPDNVTFYDISTYDPMIVKTGQYVFRLATFGKYLKLKYTISGTSASFTFSATFEGKNNYGV